METRRAGRASTADGGRRARAARTAARVKPPPRANAYRDAWAGDARRASAPARRSRVAGWVHRRRDHGGLIFIDLRDRSGIVQLVFHPDRAPEAHAPPHALRSEHVLTRRRRRSCGATRATSTRTSRPARSSCAVDELDAARRRRDAAVPDRRGRRRSTRRCACATARSTCAARRCSEALALRHRVDPDDARRARRARLPRDRDADPHALDARGRARLPRAGADRARAASTRCRSRRSCSSSC